MYELRVKINTFFPHSLTLILGTNLVKWEWLSLIHPMKQLHVFVFLWWEAICREEESSRDLMLRSIHLSLMVGSISCTFLNKYLCLQVYRSDQTHIFTYKLQWKSRQILYSIRSWLWQTSEYHREVCYVYCSF